MNASAGYRKRCGGLHMASGSLFAHPWPIVLWSFLSLYVNVILFIVLCYFLFE